MQRFDAGYQRKYQTSVSSRTDRQTISRSDSNEIDIKVDTKVRPSVLLVLIIGTPDRCAKDKVMLGLVPGRM